MNPISRLYTPRQVPRTGDDSAATSILSYVWRMTGWHQVSACAIAVLVAALNLAPIELQRRIVNEVVETQNVPLLMQFGLLYLAIVILHQIAKFVLRTYQSWLTESANIYTRRHLLELYGGQTEDADTDGEGRVVSIVGSEVEKLGGFVGEALSQACANIALLLGVLTYMFVVEPLIALFALFFMLPQILVTPLMQRRLNDLVEERVGFIRTLGDRVSELDGSDKEGPAILGRIFDNRIRFGLLKFALKAALNLMNALGPLSVLLFGGYLVMQGETEVGVIVAFISGFERISGPVRELVSFYRVAEQARVQHEMVARWMERVLKEQGQ